MTIRRCFRTLLLCLTLLTLLSGAALAGGENAPFAAVIQVPGLGEVEISPQSTQSGEVLCLPSAAQPEALVLRFPGESALLTGARGSLQVESGVPFSLLPLLEENGRECRLTFERGETRVSFTLLRSPSLGSAYLASGDPEQGRSYVDGDKSRKAKGVSFALLRPDGSPVWAGELKNIKSRGNSTWSYPKKPYQIKLSEKADLLETGIPAERESTWILLANYVDDSLLRNQFTFDLAAELGLPYIPHSASVDLYYDGEYRGVYLLCEKTEISKGRVALHDLEGDIEDANPDIPDMADLSGAELALSGGLTCRCYPELADPEDVRGGYLLEMDFENRAREEASWFRTENGQYIAVKSPEYVPEAAMGYIADLYQRFERAVFAGGTDPVTGQDYRELCDLDSLARCLLLLELSQDNDACFSSTFFYKPLEEDKLYAGPVWDFDTGYGKAALPEELSVLESCRLGNSLLRIPSFRVALRSCWQELKSLTEDVLLSPDPAASAGRLKSLSGYDGITADARYADRILWDRGAADKSLEELRAFLLRRVSWMEEKLDLWQDGVIPVIWSFTDVTPKAWYFEPVEYVAAQGLFVGDGALRFHPEQIMNRAMTVTVFHRMLGAPAAGKPSGFLDISPSNWYANAVDWAKEAGITQGVGEQRFAPDAPVTREEYVTMLYRCLLFTGIRPEGKADLSLYPDGEEVDPWAAEAMAWAVENRILQGMDGRLNPRGSATRAQAATILARFLQTFPIPESGN